jgi:hypothetical protein
VCINASRSLSMGGIETSGSILCRARKNGNSWSTSDLEKLNRSRKRLKSDLMKAATRRAEFCKMSWSNCSPPVLKYTRRSSSNHIVIINREVKAKAETETQKIGMSALGKKANVKARRPIRNAIAEVTRK